MESAGYGKVILACRTTEKGEAARRLLVFYLMRSHVPLLQDIAKFLGMKSHEQRFAFANCGGTEVAGGTDDEPGDLFVRDVLALEMVFDC